MEMEDDMEVGLVQQFSCLGTTDKEVLVAQLQKLIGPQLNTSAAHFFLDMNNWNLQLAIGAYFDLTEDSPPPSTQSSNPAYPALQANGAASQASWEVENNWDCSKSKTSSQNQNQPVQAYDSNFQSSIRSDVTTNAYSMSIIQDMSLTEDTIIPPRTKFIKQWKIRNTGNLPWPAGCHLRIISGNRSMSAQEKIFTNSLQPGEFKEVFVELMSPDNPGNYQICWQMSTAEGFLFGDEIWVIVTVGPDMTVGLTERLQSLSCDNNRVNYPVVQLMTPPNNCPLTNAQVPTAAAVGGGDVSFAPLPPDHGTDMS